MTQSMDPVRVCCETTYMRINQVSCLIIGLFLLVACKEKGPELVPLDLLSEGISLKINAPAGAVVKSSDMLIMKDITVKDSTGYNIQIFESEASALDPKTIVDRLVTEIEGSSFFDSFVEKVDNGFIYKKVIDENYVNYDFRHVKVHGDKQYIIQAGLSTTYTLDQIKLMYNSVQ